METVLFLQDSANPGLVLYDNFVNSCQNASVGAGAYAFVSLAGIELLFDSPEFCLFLEKGEFTLIVGMDAITNTKSINRLKVLENEYKNLKVLAFICDRTNSIFHPKLVWFQTENRCKLIVGSGNLTLAGLRFNAEAYTDSEFSSSEFASIRNDWNSWLDNNSMNLYKLDEEIVTLKAQENDIVSRAIKGIVSSQRMPRKRRASVEQTVQDISEIDGIENEWSFSDDCEILIAEIPKSGNRWKQVNFDKGTFINYFGAIVGSSTKFILLRPVLSDLSLGEIERRQNVTVASQNYRFELGLAIGDYPTNGRPIGIFAKLGNATFLYELLMPTMANYNEVVAFLDSKQSVTYGRLRRLRFSAAEVKSAIPNLNIIKYLK